jgi:hypothetical protein
LVAVSLSVPAICSLRRARIRSRTAWSRLRALGVVADHEAVAGSAVVDAIDLVGTPGAMHDPHAAPIRVCRRLFARPGGVVVLAGTKRVREVRMASLARLISSYDEDPELCERVADIGFRPCSF